MGLAALVASCLLTGCASQGPLHPPSLKLPAPVRGLAADRVGDAVDLHWTTPTKTTDGVGLAGKHGAGALTAEICRSETGPESRPPAASRPAASSRASRATVPPSSCAAPGRVAVTAGDPADFHDVLPAGLLTGALRPLHYRVRVLNGRGKGAQYVVVDTLAGMAPPAVRGLTAAPETNGVGLRWQPDPAADGDRTVLRVERVRLPVAGSPQVAAGSPPHSDLLAVEPATHDSGGAIDSEAKQGIEQRYTVFRTRTLRSGEKDVTASSPPTTVTVSAAARALPPLPPTGLEALVNTLGAPEIDLVWQPADGAAGYLVFRAEGSGAPVRLTPQPTPGLSYADTAIHAGGRYRYSVVSVDAAGSIGSPGLELVQAVPQP